MYFNFVSVALFDIILCLLLFIIAYYNLNAIPKLT